MNSVRAVVVVALLFGGVALAGPSLGQLSGSFSNWRDHPAIAYTSRPAVDVVADVNRRIQQGSVQLTFAGPSGYLRSTLEILNVPVESQIAVFAPDSVQRARINPGNPRTIFFNDSVAVGWVRGGFIELAAQDPEQGTIFYSLEGTEVGRPQFRRRDDCLTCHYSYSTVGVAGMLVRSAGQFTVDHTVPLEKRWGGWYVTGNHGSVHHLGNVDLDKISESPPPPNAFNWPSFEGKFDTTGYLSTQSDIVALMVFEHQMHAMNLMTRMGWEARVADYRHRMSLPLGSTPDSQGDAPVALDVAAREVVDYLLFIDEAPLADRIQGSSNFAAHFMALGPRDQKGRSLRDLDLQTRLMRYPCSYLIYSDAFDHLPSAAKGAIYQRMWQVLSGNEQDLRYRRLSTDDRKAIMEILRETKRDLPSYFE